MHKHISVETNLLGAMVLSHLDNEEAKNRTMWDSCFFLSWLHTIHIHISRVELLQIVTKEAKFLNQLRLNISKL